MQCLNLDNVVDSNWLRDKIAEILVDEIDEDFDVWLSCGLKIGIVPKTSRAYRLFLQYIGGWPWY
mgnify:CR=1 FL=1